MPAIDVIYLTYQVVVIVGVGLHWLLRAKPRTPRRLGEMLLHWSLVVNQGLAGLMGCYAHTVRARQTAEEIGRAPGSPFQHEGAGANLPSARPAIRRVPHRGLCRWRPPSAPS